MPRRRCLRCVYVRCDPEKWLRCHNRGQSLVPACANHPLWPGRLHKVPGSACRNYQARPAEPKGDVRYIPLGDGFYAYVDTADYERLIKYHWRLQNGYAGRRVQGKTIYLHGEIVRPPRGMMVDHANHHRLDNRRANLRVCTRQQNTQNNSKHIDSSSRFKGVGYSKEHGWWFAKIWFEGQRIWLGTFDDDAEAAHAYDRKAVELFGEFAHLNFPEEWPPERRQQVYAEAQPLRDALTAKPSRAKTRKGESKRARGKGTTGCARTPGHKGYRCSTRDTKRVTSRTRQKARRAARA